jgi:hypothetical protein
MKSEKEMAALAGESHPDESQLLLALEHELPPDGISEIEEHLGQCWSCRARSEEIQRGILAFVEYRENRYLPSLAEPPNEFRGFPGKLRKLVVEIELPGPATRLRRSLQSLLTLPAYVRWSPAVALITIVALLWAQLFNHAVVSADELLTRAIAAQNPTVPANGSGPKRKTVRQRVQIRSGARTVVRTFEWTLGDTKNQSRWELQEDLDQWNTPLTAESFAEWRNSLASKSDGVTRSLQLLTLTTTPQTGTIKQASIIVRATDFHPLEQRILFSDEQELDFLELGFEVADDVAPTRQPAPQQTSSPAPGQNVKPRGNLDEIEFAVRYKLFTDKLDIGEDLQISQIANEVMVAGVASSKERADAIISFLAGMEDVRVKVTFPQAGNVSTLPGDSAGTTTKDTRVAAAPPLGEALLSKEFPSSNEKAYFVNAWLTASDEVLSHVWAVKQLADRYSDSEESRLSPGSRDKLREMLRIHLGAAAQANSDLDSLLKLLPGSQDATLPDATDLRSGITLLLRQVQEQDSLVAKLVANTPAGGEDLAGVSQKLRNSHGAVQALSVRLRDLSEAR